MKNNKDITRREYINGVTVEYGNYRITNNPTLNKYLYLNSIKFYDYLGNEFYANFDDINDAIAEQCKLADRGVASVIGPKAPIKNYDTGELIETSEYFGCALYIENKKQKRLVKGRC